MSKNGVPTQIVNWEYEEKHYETNMFNDNGSIMEDAEYQFQIVHRIKFESKV